MKKLVFLSAFVALTLPNVMQARTLAFNSDIAGRYAELPTESINATLNEGKVQKIEHKTNNINIEKLSKGTYFIKIKTEEKTVIEQIIKK